MSYTPLLHSVQLRSLDGPSYAPMIGLIAALSTY
jgi:hypothetical protein